MTRWTFIFESYTSPVESKQV